MTKRIFILEAKYLLKKSSKSENPEIAYAAKRILDNKMLFEEFVKKRIEKYNEKKKKIISKQ